MRRKKKRKLKKRFKIILITVPIVVALAVLAVFAFRLRTVKVSSDLNQFTEAEVKAYMDAKKIDNTLIFWFRNKIGKSQNMDLFEDYSVKMNSPFQVTITAYEKKFVGFIKSDEMYYYVDDTGRILKISSEKPESVTRIAGLDYNKLVLYEKIDTDNQEKADTLLKVINAIQEYDFNVKKIKISDELETTLFIKKIRVQLGKESNLDKKLLDLNDIYDNVVKYKGVLNMKRVSSDGSYTLKRTE